MIFLSLENFIDVRLTSTVEVRVASAGLNENSLKGVEIGRILRIL
jgi:hypothetical protein